MRAPYLLLSLLSACAGPTARDPGTAYAQVSERYARAQAIELSGILRSTDFETRIDFRAALPAAGSLEITTVSRLFGETQSETQRWIGDGNAIYLLNDAQKECVLTAASWRQLEVLSQLDFLSPAWALGQQLAAASVEWGLPEREGLIALRLFDADGALSREYQIQDNLIMAAQGWTAEGDWTFTAHRAALARAASATAYRNPLPPDYTVLGSPYDEFNHLRGLLEPGEYAPEITLVNLDGSEQTLSDFRGRPILIAFWFYH